MPDPRDGEKRARNQHDIGGRHEKPAKIMGRKGLDGLETGGSNFRIVEREDYEPTDRGNCAKEHARFKICNRTGYIATLTCHPDDTPTLK